MSDEDRYGFRWGPLIVQRTASLHRGKQGEWRVLTLKTDAGRTLDVYVSPTGRSVRVFDRGEELRR